MDDLMKGCELLYTALCERTGVLPDPETPRRMADAYKELCGEPEAVNLKDFPLGVEHSFAEGIVTLDNIPFTSLCNHHLLPFFGTVRVGYFVGMPLCARFLGTDEEERLLSHGRVLGISKLARIVKVAASKPQIQEQLADEVTFEVSKALEDLEVSSPGVCAEVVAQHLCITSRGARVPARMTYLSTRGKKLEIECILGSWGLRQG